MDADQCQAITSASTVPASSHNNDYDDLLSVGDDPPMEEGMIEKYTVVSRASAHSRVSAQVTVLPGRMLSAHSRVSAQVGCA